MTTITTPSRDRIRQVSAYIRQMRRCDVRACNRLDHDVFENAWSMADLVDTIGDAVAFSDVAIVNGAIAGYCTGSATAYGYEIERIAVAPSHQRYGIGRALVDRVIARLDTAGRDCLRTTVSECTLPALQFFRAIGWRCFDCIPEAWGPGYDGYVFEFSRSGARPLPLFSRRKLQRTAHHVPFD